MGAVRGGGGGGKRAAGGGGKAPQLAEAVPGRGAGGRSWRWQRGRSGGGPLCGAGAAEVAADPLQGLPLLKPPYGILTAIDLDKGDIAWEIAHGETPDNVRNNPALKGLTIPRTGQAGNIGPLATKSLVIIGDSGVATTPSGERGAPLRAYDKATGKEVGAVFMPARAERIAHDLHAERSTVHCGCHQRRELFR